MTQQKHAAGKPQMFAILNYMITSNHIHLIVADDGDLDVIPKSMQLVAGRTGQEYNVRKDRKGVIGFFHVRRFYGCSQIMG